MTEDKITQGNNMLHQIRICNNSLKFEIKEVIIRGTSGLENCFNNDNFPAILNVITEAINEEREILKAKFKAL